MLSARPQRVLPAALALVLGACQLTPNYSTTPEIAPNNVRVAAGRAAGGALLDSVVITIDWRDGDGDLGNLPNQAAAPQNYFLKLYKRKGTTFREIIPPSLTPPTPGNFYGAFARLDPADSKKAAPLRGTLTYRLLLSLGGAPAGTIDGVRETLAVGDVLRFEVAIADRAGNRSNTITTNEVTLIR